VLTDLPDPVTADVTSPVKNAVLLMANVISRTCPGTFALILNSSLTTTASPSADKQGLGYGLPG
jgi:hypothetical protein